MGKRRFIGFIRRHGLAAIVVVAFLVAAAVVSAASPSRRVGPAAPPAVVAAHKRHAHTKIIIVKATRRAHAGHRVNIEALALSARVCSVAFKGPSGSRRASALRFSPQGPVLRVSFAVAQTATPGLWRLGLRCGISRHRSGSLGTARLRLTVHGQPHAHGALFAGGSAVIQSSVVAARETTPAFSSPVSVPGASPPIWLPIRHKVMIGCVLTNCHFNGRPYHGYWAIDLLNPNHVPGDPIYPAGGGRVHIISRSSKCGPIGSGTPANAVAVDHGHGLVTWYYHFQKILVTEGETVTPDTELGTMDSTGMNFPCPVHHLHFEEVLNGKPIYFGTLQACHGNTLVQYPAALGVANWDSIPPFVSAYDIYSDGTGCVNPPYSITQFSHGITSASHGITAGPDGNIWFTEFESIGRITRTGSVTEFAQGLSQTEPWDITKGPDGNLWSTLNGIDEIARITPLGAIRFFSGLTAGSDPYDITAGPDGNLWFAQHEANGGTLAEIGRITPAGHVSEFTFGITGNSKPLGITAGPDGNLWFTESGGDRIGRITPAGHVTEFSHGISHGSLPYEITAGADGNLWFTEAVGNRIGRITPAGVVTEFSAGITPNADLLGIAAGPDGNVWFAEGAGNKVGRITPAGVVTEFSKGLSPSSAPGAITTGPDGNMWFTELNTASVGRLKLP